MKRRRGRPSYDRRGPLSLPRRTTPIAISTYSWTSPVTSASSASAGSANNSRESSVPQSTLCQPMTSSRTSASASTTTSSHYDLVIAATYRDAQRLADVLAAIDAIRSHLERGELADGLVFDAIRIRLLEIGEAVKLLPADVLATEPTIRLIAEEGVSGIQRLEP